MIVMIMKTMMMMKALQLDQTRVGQQKGEDTIQALPSTGWMITEQGDELKLTLRCTECYRIRTVLNNLNDKYSMQDEGHVSDLEDTDNAHIPKVSTTSGLSLFRKRRDQLHLNQNRPFTVDLRNPEEAAPSLMTLDTSVQDLCKTQFLQHHMFHHPRKTMRSCCNHCLLKYIIFPPRNCFVSQFELAIVVQRAVDPVGSPSSTTIDQDEQSTSTSPSNQEI
ncbi:hypothetical protein Tco_1219168 [Tanacetum coccineum]